MKMLVIPSCVVLPVLLALAPGLAAERPFQALPLGEVDPGCVNPALSVQNVGPGLTAIALRDPQILLADTLVAGERFTMAAIEGEAVAMNDGRPVVPSVSRMYQIPDAGAVEVVVRVADYEVLDDVDILPFQGQIDDAQRVRAYRDEDLYSRDEWYPPEVAELGYPAIMRDLRTVTVTLLPVQYNPRRRQARIYHNLEVDLVTSHAPGENELVRSGPVSRLFLPLYRSLLPNLDESTLDEVTTAPGTLLVLSHHVAGGTWGSHVANYADWKRRMGYNVVVRRVTDSEAGDPRDIRDIVQQVYLESNRTLEFVMVMGDGESGAGNLIASHTGGEWNGWFDHFYACLDYSGQYGFQDSLEDVAVGRIPAETAAQLGLAISKIIQYERDPYMEDPAWLTRAFLHAGTNNGVNSFNRLNMQWAGQQLMQYTNVDDLTLITHQQELCNTYEQSRMRTQLEAGVGFYLWRGTWIGNHAGCDPELANFVTGQRKPITMTLTCLTGSFTGGTRCLSELWMINGANQGGVCGIGLAGSHTDNVPDNSLISGFVYTMCNLGSDHLGIALIGGKVNIWRAHAFAEGIDRGILARNYRSYTAQWANIMGDASMAMWKGVPALLAPEHAAYIPVGARALPVTVLTQEGNQPVPDAIVVAKIDTLYYRAVTDSSGTALLPIVVNVADTLDLTITKPQHHAYEAAIPCVQTENQLALWELNLDDDNLEGTSGNNDQLLNPGETADLLIALKNFGTAPSQDGAAAALSCSSPLVTITGGSQVYPAAAPDAITPVRAFRIAVHPSAPHLDSLLFTLAVTSHESVQTSHFRLTIHAGQAVFVNTTLSNVSGDGDGLLDPGETGTLTITVRNGGDRLLPSVSATLSSLDGLVYCSDALGVYGDIAPNAMVTNTADPYTVSALSCAYRGYPARLRLVLSCADGFQDTVLFTLPLATPGITDPTGPDAYGYYAYDNVDTSFSAHYPYSYININTTGTRLPLNDPGEELETDPVYLHTVALPFTFGFYGQQYDSITICSNGWAAFGHLSQLDIFRNYPLPGPHAPRAMIAAFCEDLKTYTAGQPNLLGVWTQHVTEAHAFVIQWRAWATNNGTMLEDFEILLLDPAYDEPAPDGNGRIVVQYQTVTDPLDTEDHSWTFNFLPYATLGIQNETATVGLTYRFGGYSAQSRIPGAANLVTGRSVVYTTRTEMSGSGGSLGGQVTDSETGLPVAGLRVSIVGADLSTLSDAQGNYEFTTAPMGMHSVLCEDPRPAHPSQPYPQYRWWRQDNVFIGCDSSAVVNIIVEPYVGGSGPEEDPALKGAEKPAPDLPTEYRLHANAPNPFNSTTLLRYDLPAAARVELRVFNSLGQLVATLVDADRPAGSHTVSWDGRSATGLPLASGLYFYQLRAGAFTGVRKMLLLK